MNWLKFMELFQNWFHELTWIRLFSDVHQQEVIIAYFSKKFDITEPQKKRETYLQNYKDGFRVLLLQGRCTYLLKQQIYIQQLSQNVGKGKLPTSTEMIFQGNIVDSVKFGDHVEIVEIYIQILQKFEKYEIPAAYLLSKNITQRKNQQSQKKMIEQKFIEIP